MEQKLCGATVQVCMSCLDTDSQMFSMSECKLEQAYEHLTGYPLFDVGNLKHTLCTECAQRLTNFEQFRDKSLRARALMMDLVEQHEVITRRHIAALRSLEHSVQASVETAWDSTDVQASVKTEPALRTDWDSADAQASDRADEQTSVKSEGSASMLWDAKLLDGALCRVLLTRMSRAEERALATRDLLKCENVTLQCTECGEEFSREREYDEHAQRHLQTRAIGSCSAAVVFPARLANADDKRKLPDNIEQAEAIQECEQELDIDNDEVDNKSSHKYNEPRQCIRSPLNICLKTRRTLFCSSDLVSKNNDTNSDETTSQELPISETIEPVTSHIITVEKVSLDNDSDVGNIVTTENMEPSYSGNDIKETSSYICDVCQHQFKRKNLLVKHIMAHSIEKPFTCKLCQYKCKYNSHLLRHMRTHTGEKPFACNLCHYKFRCKSHLVEHIRTHTGEKPFVCKLCHYTCARNSNLLQHMRTHTGEKPFVCKLCHYTYARNSNFVQHMRTHTGEKPFVCKLCHYTCARNSNLVQHMRTHTGEKPFVCKLCHYKCAKHSHLVQHMRTHTGEKPFVCKLCHYKCASNSDLVRHMRTHTGEKPFVCKLCHYTCARNSNLLQHMRTHTGEKPFVCKLCHYTCARNSNLVQHMRTHTGEKPFVCKLCHYKCASNSDLVRHMRTHTGEKPFACEFCSYKCAVKRSLLKHMRSHTHNL
nr:zinc finger protein 502-like [Maniola hyperantus]